MGVPTLRLPDDDMHQIQRYINPLPEVPARLVNLTQHTIRYIPPTGGMFPLLPEDLHTRISSSTLSRPVELRMEGGGPVVLVDVTARSIIDPPLPPEDGRTLYVVSYLVAEALRDVRSDLVTPGRAVYDRQNGNRVGTASFRSVGPVVAL